MKLRPYILLLSAVALLLTGCNDIALDEIVNQVDNAPSADAIQIDGEDTFYSLDHQGKTVVSMEVENGDFITQVDETTLYFEQNDEQTSRLAKLNIKYQDGSSRTLQFNQKTATRSVEGKQFLRHHGVGYSYNAVEGKYCNLGDFRCQILNRAMLEKVGDVVKYNFLTASNLNELKYTHSSYSSVTDYIQNSNIEATGKGSIVVFQGDASATYSIFEEGQKKTYILKNDIWINRAEYSVDENAICEYAKQYPALLTSSFRKAVSELKTNADIDNFLDKYGTHVVVYSKLGARLSLEVQVETNKFKTRAEVELMANASIATLFKYKNETSMQNQNYEILRNGTCRLTALGGDLSYLDKVIDLDHFTNDEVSESMMSDWIQSVQHDDDDLNSSNVEMIDMEVTPIWEFIPDDKIAKMVEARVTGNVSYIAETFGNKNFVNTSFNMQGGTFNCKIGGKSQKFTDPDVIEIIVANRHVATICHEYVPEITGSSNPNEKVWVAYPIYEGHIQIENGLCIYNGIAYDVAWSGSFFTISERSEVPNGDNVYMNLGVLSTAPADNLSYQTAHYILGCERPGGVKTDGSLGGQMVKIYKYLGHFYLLQDLTEYKNLPGWSWTEVIHQGELENYPSFFTIVNSKSQKDKNGYPYRMWRDDDYTYIYNPKEVSYE